MKTLAFLAALTAVWPGLALAQPALFIDPGHGRGDPGVQAGGLSEADLTFEMATQLEASLEARGLDCQLSHDASASPSSAARAAAANASGAKAFLSLHFNHSPSATVRGPRIFIPKPLPAKNPGEPSRWDKAAGQHSDEAKALAMELARSLSSAETGKLNVQNLNLVQFKGLALPGVVVELGFLSHPESVERFKDPEFRKAMVARLAEGILAWAVPAGISLTAGVP